MWNLMQARRQIVIDTYGEIATLPPDAVVEKEITLPKGGTHSVYTLSEEHRLFIESVEAIAEAKFSDQNYQATLDKSRAALVYLAGQIPHVHGRFEEALPRLISVMTQFPDSPEALWARAMVFEELTTDPSSAVNLQAETSCNAWRTVVHSGLAEAKPIPLEGLLAAGTEYINTCGAKRIDRNLVDDVIQRTTKTTGATAPLIAAIWQQGPISRTMKRQLNKDLKRMLAAEDEGALELCRDLRDRASGLTACAAAASQKRPHDKAKVAASDAESSEHAESIRSVVRRKKSQVQYCYEKRLKENPNISGRLVIMVDIDKGRVTQVRIEANKTGDKEIESCVKSKVKRWRFSPETTDSIVLPFALSSK
jgi:hypothetical protein